MVDMAPEEQPVPPSDNSAEIKDTDIVFDCPYCGKSLAIDYRGAGLSVPCTDCGNYVQVPIPEGMDISDIDSADEDNQQKMLFNLRKSLAVAESRLEKLQKDFVELTEKQQNMEKSRDRAFQKLSAVRENLIGMKRCLDDMVRHFERIQDILKDDIK
jgi:transcription elongation factor Elf1